MNPIWPIVVSGLLSTLIATAINLYVQHRAENRKRKLECLRRLAASRTAPLPTPEFMQALNEIFVTFNDALAVMDSLGRFNRAVRGAGHRNEDLLDLMKAMMRDLKLNDVIDDDFLLTPFGVNVRAPGSTGADTTSGRRPM